jgi:16S rRNA C967 or C1407 C5-methylase (RsmB/RsmF family)
MSAKGTCAMSRESALPLAFLARMAVLLDEEFPAFLAALSRPRHIGLRVNTLKLTTDRFEALSPWPLAPVPWCPQGYLLPYDTNAGLYPLHDAGLYYIQEPSTMAVGTLLAPQPGERVLDLCAAPGGKSTHIAALLAGQGLLVSNEIDLKRAQVLQHNLDRWGARNIVVLNESPERLAEHWPGAFDRVLVDAPCSGEGMFRKNVEARYHWSEAHVRGCALRQRAILDSAAHLVRPGGILAYATCTFAPEENEGVIARFLQRFPDFVLEEPAWFPGFAPGHPEWSTWPSAQRHDDPEESGTGPSRPLEAGPGPSGQPAGPDTLARTVRLWPHRLEGEGHFIAIMRHTGAADRPAWPVAAADLSLIHI